MRMLLLSVQHSSQIGVSTVCFWIRQKLMRGHCWINVMMLLLLMIHRLVVMTMMIIMMVVMLLVSAWTMTP
jgi:hypothetical protein